MGYREEENKVGCVGRQRERESPHNMDSHSLDIKEAGSGESFYS